MQTHQISRITRWALLPVASAAFVLGAQAQTGTDAKAAGPTAAGASSAEAATPTNYRAVRASKVIGLDVRNEKGENLGEISDMIVDMTTGDVRYAVLRFDPGVFSGERLFAVPTQELRLGPDREHVVYRMNRERLEQTSITAAEWTNRFFDSPERMARLDRAAGIQQPTAGAKAHRLSDLIGRDVQSRSGENIGEIEDVVINMAQQKVHYAVLHFDLGWTTPDKRVVFPLRSFDLVAGKDNLILDVDKSKIRAMKDFTPDQYASLSNPVWLVDVDRYLITVAPLGTEGTSAGSTMGASRAASPQAAASPQVQGQQGSTSVASSESMQKLQQSAQRLRESIQAMAQRQPGPDRDQAIDQAHQALRETNGAMFALLESQQSTRVKPSTVEYDKSVKQLMKAADNLRQSIQAMAKQPPGESRMQAISQANEALLETQQAMVMAYRPTPGSSQQLAGGSKEPVKTQGSSK